MPGPWQHDDANDAQQQRNAPGILDSPAMRSTGRVSGQMVIEGQPTIPNGPQQRSGSHSPFTRQANQPFQTNDINSEAGSPRMSPGSGSRDSSFSSVNRATPSGAVVPNRGTRTQLAARELLASMAGLSTAATALLMRLPTRANSVTTSPSISRHNSEKPTLQRQDSTRSSGGHSPVETQRKSGGGFDASSIRGLIAAVRNSTHSGGNSPRRIIRSASGSARTFRPGAAAGPSDSPPNRLPRQSYAGAGSEPSGMPPQSPSHQRLSTDGAYAGAQRAAQPIGGILESKTAAPRNAPVVTSSLMQIARVPGARPMTAGPRPPSASPAVVLARPGSSCRLVSPNTIRPPANGVSIEPAYGPGSSGGQGWYSPAGGSSVLGAACMHRQSSGGNAAAGSNAPHRASYNGIGASSGGAHGTGYPGSGPASTGPQRTSHSGAAVGSPFQGHAGLLNSQASQFSGCSTPTHSHPPQLHSPDSNSSPTHSRIMRTVTATGGLLEQVALDLEQRSRPEVNAPPERSNPTTPDNTRNVLGARTGAMRDEGLSSVSQPLSATKRVPILPVSLAPAGNCEAVGTVPAQAEAFARPVSMQSNATHPQPEEGQWQGRGAPGRQDSDSEYSIEFDGNEQDDDDADNVEYPESAEAKQTTAAEAVQADAAEAVQDDEWVGLAQDAPEAEQRSSVLVSNLSAAVQSLIVQQRPEPVGVNRPPAREPADSRPTPPPPEALRSPARRPLSEPQVNVDLQPSPPPRPPSSAYDAAGCYVRQSHSGLGSPATRFLGEDRGSRDSGGSASSVMSRVSPVQAAHRLTANGTVVHSFKQPTSTASPTSHSNVHRSVVAVPSPPSMSMSDAGAAAGGQQQGQEEHGAGGYTLGVTASGRVGQKRPPSSIGLTSPVMPVPSQGNSIRSVAAARHARISAPGLEGRPSEELGFSSTGVPMRLTAEGMLEANRPMGGSSDGRSLGLTPMPAASGRPALRSQTAQVLQAKQPAPPKSLDGGRIGMRVNFVEPAGLQSTSGSKTAAAHKSTAPAASVEQSVPRGSTGDADVVNVPASRSRSRSQTGASEQPSNIYKAAAIKGLAQGMASEQPAAHGIVLRGKSGPLEPTITAGTAQGPTSQTSSSHWQPPKVKAETLGNDAETATPVGAGPIDAPAAGGSNLPVIKSASMKEPYGLPALGTGARASKVGKVPRSQSDAKAGMEQPQAAGGTGHRPAGSLVPTRKPPGLPQCRVS